jgi:hypothetical protein
MLTFSSSQFQFKPISYLSHLHVLFLSSNWIQLPTFVRYQSFIAKRYYHLALFSFSAIFLLPPLLPLLQQKKVEVEYVSKKTGSKKKGVTKVQGTHKIEHTFIPSPSDTVELFTDEEMIKTAKYLALGKLSKDFAGPNVTIV